MTGARPLAAGPVPAAAETEAAEARLAFSPAAAQAEAIRCGTVTSRALAQLHLARIARFRHLNAIVCEDEAAALRTADACDSAGAAARLGRPLHGVPVTVKASFDIAGLPTTVNFPPLRRRVAARDSVVVARLREAGAVILGKTNVPMLLADYQTFGPLYPAAANPHDPSRTPGGSTGGGAAAVAAGLCALEIGSDLAGSLRVPAHFCGLFALKPTENGDVLGEGHVPPMPGSRGGIVAMAAIGPLARSMADIALAWEVLGQPAPAAPAAAASPLGPLRGRRIGWFDAVGPVACGEGTRAVLAAFTDRLAREGALVEHRPFDPRWVDEAFAVWGLFFGAMIAQDAPWLARRLVGWELRRRWRGSRFGLPAAVAAGLAIDFRGFSRALARRRDLVADVSALFGEVDFLVGPVAAGPAFPHDSKRRAIALDGRSLAYADYAAPFAILYNATGNPALVVPAGRSAEGLPIGLQIAARHGAEADLIRLGKALEGLGYASPAPAGYGAPRAPAKRPTISAQ